MSIKDSVLTGSLVLLTASAVTLTAVNVRETIRHRAPTDPIRTVSDWQAYGRTGHLVGKQDRKVSVVVFSDYECPACKASLPHLLAIRDKYPEDVSLVIRHYPLQGHPQARPAAEAAVCAAKQGRFEQFHREVFARDTELEGDEWFRFASAAGVRDSTSFARCLQDPATRAAVEADLAAGNRLGVPGTPTYLINDELFSGLSGLEKVVERHINARAGWFGS